MTYLEALAQWWSVVKYLDKMAHRQRNDESRRQYNAAFTFAREVAERVSQELPHDAYWDGVCTRCGRVRRVCEALRQRFWMFRCQEIKDCKDCGEQYVASRGSCGCHDKQLSMTAL